MSKKKKDWKTEKERLLSLGQDERRKEYRRQDFISLDKIPTWREENEDADKEAKEQTGGGGLSDKISLYKGDITVLEVDAIVNAANSGLLGGGGVDGCIHKAAGSCLHDECHSLNGCETGKAKITCGYDLPARYVIHTVGPVARGHVGPTETNDLHSCYQNSLRLMEENDLSTVAFPCISTGIYGFPNEPAADIALKTVMTWIEENPDKIKRVIFCVFLEMDFNIYKKKMSVIFQDNDMEVKAAEQNRGKMEPGDEEEDDNGAAAPDEDVIMESQTQDENSAIEEQNQEQSEMGTQGKDIDLDTESQKDTAEEKEVTSTVAEKEQEQPAKKTESDSNMASCTDEMEVVSDVNNIGTSNIEDIKDHIGSPEEPDSSPDDSIQSKENPQHCAAKCFPVSPPVSPEPTPLLSVLLQTVQTVEKKE